MGGAYHKVGQTASRTTPATLAHISTNKFSMNDFLLKDSRTLTDQMSFVLTFSDRPLILAVRDRSRANKNKIATFAFSVATNDLPHDRLQYCSAVSDTWVMPSVCPNCVRSAFGSESGSANAVVLTRGQPVVIRRHLPWRRLTKPWPSALRFSDLPAFASRGPIFRSP